MNFLAELNLSEEVTKRSVFSSSEIVKVRLIH